MTTAEYTVPKTVGEAEAALEEMREELDGQIAVLRTAIGELKTAGNGIDRLKTEVGRHD